MSWHLIPAQQGMHFLTCDTPAHIFESLGLRSPGAEFTITLSKDFALVAENTHNYGVYYNNTSSQLTKEINRRILSHAERFVFSSFKADWIAQVAHKEIPNLNRIDWTK